MFGGREEEGGKFAGIIRSLVNVYENVRVVLRNLCLIHNSIEGVDEIRNKEKKKLVRFNFDETWIAFRSDLDFFFLIFTLLENDIYYLIYYFVVTLQRVKNCY